MINHTRTTGPVVFLHRSSATKLVENITGLIEILQWCTQSLLLLLGLLEDMTLTHYTPMVLLLEQYIHLDLHLNTLIINTSLT